jgi:hypothetical protein
MTATNWWCLAWLSLARLYLQLIDVARQRFVSFTRMTAIWIVTTPRGRAMLGGMMATTVERHYFPIR